MEDQFILDESEGNQKNTQPNIQNHVNTVPEVQQPTQNIQPEQDLSDEFQCTICLGPLQYPVSMPCGHTTCYTCLKQYIINGVEGQIKCPLCSTPFKPKELRNVYFGKKDGIDPRPKDMEQELVNKNRRQHNEENLNMNQEHVQRFVMNINGFQFQIGGAGRAFNIPFLQPRPQRELTRAEKIKRFFSQLFCILLLLILVIIYTRESMQQFGVGGAPTKSRIFYYSWQL